MTGRPPAEAGSEGTPSDRAVLAAFGEFFDAFLNGSLEELVQRVALPYFDLRGGQLTEVRSQAQMEGFRRGLRARMASLGILSAKLTDARVLAVDGVLAVVLFESTRNGGDGSVLGTVRSLGFLKVGADGAWRVWMVSVLQAE